MSWIRKDAEDILSYFEQISPRDHLENDLQMQSQRVLILLDALEEHCLFCDHPREVCQHCWITKAIAKAEQV